MEWKNVLVTIGAVSCVFLPPTVLQGCALFSSYWINYQNDTIKSGCYRGVLYTSGCPDGVEGIVGLSGGICIYTEFGDYGIGWASYVSFLSPLYLFLLFCRKPRKPRNGEGGQRTHYGSVQVAGGK
ncbi:uncharacterized protein LOC144627328 [Crassostrea virginica]